MDILVDGHHVLSGRAIRHVVFDWNGTLLDDAQAMYDAWHETAMQFNMYTPTYGEWQAVSKRPFRQYYDNLRRMVAGLPLSDEEYVKVGAYWDRVYLELAEKVGLVPHVAELLNACTEQGITTSICSIHYTWHVHEGAEKLGVRDKFHVIRGREPEDLNETKASYLKKLVALLLSDGLISSPDEVLMVGDIQDDAISAKDAGVYAALVASGEECVDFLSQVGCPVYSDLKQLADALFLADAPTVNTVN